MLAYFVLALLFWLRVSGSEPTPEDDSKPNDVGVFLPVTDETFSELIASSSVTFVYFNKKDPRETSPFLRAYNIAASYLSPYKINVATFDCFAKDDEKSLCAGDISSDFINVYQNGVKMIFLEREYLFDVSSIMSYALQLAMLHEVPVIQSRLERVQLQKTFIGQRDLVFINPVAAGSPAHRIFMEIAHAYMSDDRIRFAMTTDPMTTIDLQGNEDIPDNSSFGGMWVMFCSEVAADTVDKEADCPNVLYRGEISLDNFETYIRKILAKSLFYAPRDGVAPLFEMTSEDLVVYVYTKDSQKWDEDIDHIFKFDLRGSGKVVMVDMDDPESKSAALKQGFTGAVPGLGVRVKDEPMHFLKNDKWTGSVIQAFLLHFMLDVYPASNFTTSMQSRKYEGGDKSLVQKLVQEVETEDDPVALGEMSMGHIDVAGLNVPPALLKDTFYRHVRRSSLLLVLFYQPYDPTSMAFLRQFSQAGQVLAQNYSTTDVLARVNCFDATDLCSQENVTLYPTLQIYRGDSVSRQKYLGHLDLNSVVKTVKLLQLNIPITLTTAEQVEEFSKGLYPSDFTKFTPSSVLLLAKDMTSDPAMMFKELAVSASQKMALAVVHPSLLQKVAKKYETSVPAVIAHNRDDQTKPIRSMTFDQGSSTAAVMSAFLSASTIALVPELGPDNFPQLYARHQPMAILFLEADNVPTRDAALTSFTDLASANRFPGITFCWMDAQAKSLGLKILSEYTWTTSLPMVSLVRHRKREVFNYQPTLATDDAEARDNPLQTNALAGWLDDVLSGQLEPSKILYQGNWGPPARFYNFLEMADDESFREIEVDVEEEDVEKPEHKSDPSADEAEVLSESDARQRLMEIHRLGKIAAAKELVEDDGIAAQDLGRAPRHSEL